MGTLHGIRDYFNALVVISPLCLGDEAKDQDRADWSTPVAVAALSDGVTSSPHSAEAAELAVKLSPMLFQGDVEERMRVLADLLVVRRLEAQLSPVRSPAGTPRAMHTVLQEAVRERLQVAFQTTLVAAAFTPTDDGVSAALVRCGDSAFFAFSPTGELLASSLSEESQPEDEEHEADDQSNTQRILFGPGDELLVKVLGTAADHPRFAEQVPTHPDKAHGWLVCHPVERCRSSATRLKHDRGTRPLALERDDILLVPRHYAGSVIDNLGKNYRLLHFSSVIRLGSSSTPGVPVVSFAGKGAVTAVLPDHVRTQQWIHTRECFPADTHFVLASDGFYSSFSDPAGLWTWLQTNRSRLLDPRKRHKAMRELHTQLHAKVGDDDISFVCVHASEAVESETSSQPAEEGGKHVC